MATGQRAHNPRERMLRLIEEQWPGFNPVARQIELAEEGRADYKRRQAKAAEDAAAVKAGTLDREMAEPHPTNADRNLLASMYDRPARYLVPRLKEMEVKVGGLDGGPVTVRFARDDVEAEKAGQ